MIEAANLRRAALQNTSDESVLTLKTALNSDPSTAGKSLSAGPARSEDSRRQGRLPPLRLLMRLQMTMPTLTRPLPRLKQHRILNPRLPGKSLAADPARSDDSMRQGRLPTERL